MGIQSFITGRGGIVAPLAVISAALIAPAAHADHSAEYSQSADLPSAGGFQLCVGVKDPLSGRETVGQCDDSPVVKRGQLTLAVSGTSSHSTTAVDYTPDACNGAAGVELTKSAGDLSATVTGTITGTGSDGEPVGKTTGPISAGPFPGSATFARACLSQVENPVPEDPSPEPPEPDTPRADEPRGEDPRPDQPPAQSPPASRQPSASSTSGSPQPVISQPLSSWLEVWHQRVRPVLARGLRLRVWCSAACDIDARLLLSAREAKRHAVARSAVALGRSTHALDGEGQRRLVIRIGGNARRKLRRVRSLRPTVRVTVTSPSGQTQVLKRRITLTR